MADIAGQLARHIHDAVGVFGDINDRTGAIDHIGVAFVTTYRHRIRM